MCTLLPVDTNTQKHEGVGDYKERALAGYVPLPLYSASFSLFLTCGPL